MHYNQPQEDCYYEQPYVKVQQEGTDPGNLVSDISGMFRTRSPGQNHPGATRTQALGSVHNPQTHPGIGTGGIIPERPFRAAEKDGTLGRISPNPAGTGSGQGCAGDDWARISLAQKKLDLGLKGPIRGRPDRQTRQALLTIITEAKVQGISQEKACAALDISSRKVRRWLGEKPRSRAPAWNRIQKSEREAILAAAWDNNLMGLPISHVYVYGHNTGKYYVSLSTVYRVLKANDLIRRRCYKTRRAGYTSVHELMAEGWSILCYDGTCFQTSSGTVVWAMPVLLLPCRYLLCVGMAMGSFCSDDLQGTIAAGIHRLPEHIREKLIAHSDRGSQMKSKTTRQKIEEWLTIPVHFGRPQVKDDHAWIEAFNKTMKYHRECPEHFATVLDIKKWLERIPNIYNHDPHSSLGYVTPEEALQGKAKEILMTRKLHLCQAQEARRLAYRRVSNDVGQK